MSSESTQYLFDIVKNWTASDYSDRKARADDALNELIARNAKPELKWIVDNWTASDYSHRKAAAANAHNALKRQ